MRRWQQLVLFGSLFLLGGVSCSDDDVGSPKKPSQPDPLSEWSIKIFVGKPGREQRVDLGPIRELSFPGLDVPSVYDGALPGSAEELFKMQPPGFPSLSPAKKHGADTSPSSKPTAAIGVGDGGVVYEQDLATKNGWALVHGALAQCAPSAIGNSGGFVNNPFIATPAVLPPWSSNSWSIFPSAPQSCDQELAFSEALLCVANELAGIADSVSTIRWENVPQFQVTGFPSGPWVIPVQSNRDRFIARDIAIYLLATIAMNDAWPIQAPGNTAGPCSSVYAQAAVDPANFGVPNAVWIFHQQNAALYFPGEKQLTAANIPKIAEVRLRYQTQILRSASRLLDELIDKSVEADLAGTAQRRAMATDPLRGSEIAWGERNNENGKYNTLAHALRVVAGRWELSPSLSPFNPVFYTADPACGGVAAGDLLEKAYGPDRAARVGSSGIRTPGQKLATEIVQGAGIVIPKANLTEADVSDAKKAVAAQLKLTSALGNGYSANDPVFDSLGGKSVDYVMDDLTEGDLAFALNASFRHYQLLTAQDDQVATVVTPTAGLVPAPDISPMLTSLGATALAGGVPRQDLSVDIMARAGQIQQASQCDEFGGIVGQFLADFGFRNSFQDSYSAGQALQRRLVVLRESVRAAQLDPLFNDVFDQSQRAVAEARGWTGPGRLIATSLPDASNSNVPGSIWLFTLGFDPDDFATKTPAGIENQIVMVYGPPWVADCAAGLRSSCPADFEQQYVAHPTFASVAAMDNPNRRNTGYDGTGGTFIFEGGSAPNFLPAFLGSGKSDNNLYVVQLHDPVSPAAKGKVLGSIALRAPMAAFGGTGAVVSEKQRKHLNDILGVGKKFRDKTAIGERSLSEGPAYCIDGVPKDLFVPLENELTSDSDQYENSFRHYLSLARQAATKADSLGQELVRLGLEQDFRREAAGEALAEICGDYTALDKIDITDGEVNAPVEDQNLNNCFGEDKYDLVFLTNDPTLDQPDPLGFAQEKLGCPQPGLEACDAATIDNIETAGLNLGTYETGNASPSGKCDELTAVATSLKLGFQGEIVKAAANTEWLHPSALKLLANRLRIDVHATGSWNLLLSGVKVMDSSPQDNAWPGCRRAGQSCTGTAALTAISDLYDSLFRRIAQPAQIPLGSGLDTLPGNADRESNFVLWRVQGTLWLIGALSGSIPEQMFVTPVPAANFNATWPDPARAPAPTVFGTARFSPFQGALQLDASGNADEDREALKAASLLNLSTFNWPDSLFAEIPNWLTDIYSTPGLYVHVAGQNPEVSGFTLPEVAPWIQQQGGRFSGMKCIDDLGAVTPFGPPIDETTENVSGLAAVAKLRRGSSWGRLCTNQAGDSLLKIDVDGSGSAFSSFHDLFFMANSATQSVPFSTPWELLQKTIPLFPGPAPDSSVQDIWSTFVKVALTDTAAQDSGSYKFPLPSCRHARLLDGSPVGVGQSGLHFIDQNCTNDEFLQFSPSSVAGEACLPGDIGCFMSAARYTKRMLLPRVCSAGSRVQAFVNSYPPVGSCGAAAQLAQALALACNFSLGGVLGTPTTRPALTKLSDLDGFVYWIDYLSLQARLQVSKLVFEGLPKRVVDDFSQLTVGSGESKGDHGIQLLELRKALETLAGAWTRTSEDLDQLGDAVQSARLDIAAANIAEDTAAAQLAIQRLTIHADVVAAAASIASSLSVKNVGAKLVTDIANGDLQMGIGEAKLAKTDELEALSQDAKANQVSQALNQLQLVSNPLYADLQNALGDIRSSAASVLQVTEQIRASEQKAKYEAAKGSGADYFIDDTGQAVKFPVNTVQRRLYDITRLRYEAALHEAKYLAYVARLAVEQRVGARLSTFTQSVGPLNAPSEWADDVCNLTGIDYEELRAFEVPDGGAQSDLDQAEKETIKGFADQFVGDYVDKLENFVDYYNIQYPAHDGDDTAVISLRDDLLGPPAGCVQEAPNLLYYSSDLTGHDFVSDGSGPVLRGWELNSCAPWDASCLHVDPQATIEVQPPMPDTAPNGGLTWLHGQLKPVAPPPGDSGLPEGGTDAAPPISGITQPGTVSQAVELTAGATYVLSWWDQARDAQGKYATQDSAPYRVAIVAPDGQQIALFSSTHSSPRARQRPCNGATGGPSS